MARGSIRKHARETGTRYEVVVDLGVDPVTGKRRQRTKSFRTKREARTALTAWLADIDRGMAVDRSRKTIAEVMAYWLDTHARPRLRPKTVLNYENAIRNHIVPELGSLPVQHLTPERLLTFYADKLASGVGARTLRLCHIYLHQALKQAAILGLVSRNVTDLVSPPKAQTREMRVWDAEQAQAFLAVADQSMYGPIWILALATGLRRGELLGVRWKDIDFDRHELHVRQTVGSLGGRIEFKPPKTRGSLRTVPLAADVTLALKQHRQRQNERRLALGPDWQDHDLMFEIGDGRPINPDNVRHDFERLVRQADVPLIRVHDLRHTFVTLALQAGADTKAVSEVIGHATIGITLAVYAHVLPKQRVDVADRVSAVLFNPGMPPGREGSAERL